MSRDFESFVHDMSNTLLGLDSKFMQIFGKPALRPEFRLIALIVSAGPISVKEAMYDSSMSHRAFYMLLDKLKNQKIVELTGDDGDARVRKIHLSKTCIDDVDALFSHINNNSDSDKNSNTEIKSSNIYFIHENEHHSRNSNT